MIGIFIALWKMYSFILFGNATSPDASAVLGCAVMVEGFVEALTIVFIDLYLEKRNYKK